jgi:uncharacterized iron-regulated protein
MRKRLFILFLMVVFCFSGLYSYGSQDILPIGPSKYKFKLDKIEAGLIKSTATQKKVSIEDIIKMNEDTDVFIIGESHDNYECHTFQRDFIEALYKKYPNIIVGFEFFRKSDDEVLEKWSKGEISEEELLNQSQWYKKTLQNYGYTRLIMDIIKKNKIKVIGLNVSRDILRKISRKGYKTLSKEEKTLFPSIQVAHPEHEFFIKSIFGEFAVQVPFWFKNIYSAQKCWDIVMAQSMKNYLSQKKYRKFKGVIIAGSNHVDFKLGIPFRYSLSNKRAKVTTIVPVTLPEKKKDDEKEEEENPMMKMMGKSLKPVAIFSRGIADYVFSITKPEKAHFPVFGFKGKMKDGSFEVSDVTKESIAEKNGISKGNLIISVDGVDITSQEQLRLILSTKGYSDKIQFTIKKELSLEEQKQE